MKAKTLLLAFVLTAISYSIFRDTVLSVWIKPLPVLCCFLLLMFHRTWHTRGAKIVLIGLGIAMLGDIALDLSATTLGIGIFTIVMALYGFALLLITSDFSWKSLIPTVLIFGGIYTLMFPYLDDRRITAAIYQLVLIWMVWRAATVFCMEAADTFPERYHRWLVFLGTVGFALNGVLYGVDLYLYTVPRDLVIQCYYLGQLLLVFGLIERFQLRSS